MILTKDEMAKAVLKALDDAVAKEFPEEEREEAKFRLLSAWSGQMFDMNMREKKK
jgi:hypothetical protein